AWRVLLVRINDLAQRGLSSSYRHFRLSYSLVSLRMISGFSTPSSALILIGRSSLPLIEPRISSPISLRPEDSIMTAWDPQLRSELLAPVTDDWRIVPRGMRSCRA